MLPNGTLCVACQDVQRQDQRLDHSMYECKELVNNQPFRTVTTLEKEAFNLDACITRLFLSKDIERRTGRRQVQFRDFLLNSFGKGRSRSRRPEATTIIPWPTRKTKVSSCCPLSCLPSPPRQTSRPRCQSVRSPTNALFFNFFMWSKVMLLKSR